MSQHRGSIVPQLKNGLITLGSELNLIAALWRNGLSYLKAISSASHRKGEETYLLTDSINKKTKLD